MSEGRRAAQRGRRARAARGLAALVLLLGIVGWPQAAGAHAFNPALLVLEAREDGRHDVRWSVTAADASGAGLLTLRWPEGCALVDDAVVETARGRVMTGVLDCGAAGLAGREVAVEGLAAFPVDVVVRLAPTRGPARVARLHRGAPRWRVPDARLGAAATTGAASALWAYGGLGVEHILLGADHLLFVLGLLLLAQSGRALVLTVTAFTAAHSLTLSAAALGWWAAPRGPVEAMIALSILLLAVELARPADAPRTWTQRWPWAVAFGFGLLHGAGFAGALAEVGLPEAQVPLALLGFNVGVELGQLAFIGAALALAAPLRRRVGATTRARLTRALIVYPMGAVAAFWLLERSPLRG